MMCWRLFKNITALLVVFLLVGFTMSCNLFGSSDNDDDGGGGNGGGSSELITITNPAAGAVVTTQTFTISGTWSGTTPASIGVSFAGQSEKSASLNTTAKTWTVSITAGTSITQGNKLISATSYDSADDDIETASVLINYAYSGAPIGYTVTISTISGSGITSGYLYAYLSESENGEPAYLSDGLNIASATSWPKSVAIESVGAGTYYVGAAVLDENDPNSTMLYIGSGGTNTISVGSSDATFSNIITLQDDDIRLASLTLTDADGRSIPLSPSFSSDEDEYTATVGFDEGTSVTVNPTASSSKASISYTPSKTVALSVGSATEIMVTVEAESGNDDDYTITVTREADDRNGIYKCSGYDEDEGDYTETYVFTNGSYTYTYDAEGTENDDTDSGTYSASNGVLTLSDFGDLYDLFEDGSFYPYACKRTSSETSGIIGTWKSLAEDDGDYEVLTIQSNGSFTHDAHDGGSTEPTNTMSGTYSVSNGVLTLTIGSTVGYTKYVLLSSDGYLSIGDLVSNSSKVNNGGYAKQ
ncbi:cadherin-like beta sandwich domain-containing protein [Sediminispirochaeta bajacaliforniensis]|uniref:cadherin-like beta sandwich domain-containing protein n=1 Tax=Sediminispirochaeta bajacaliforniensis TaxID=148 RepID=UPI0003719B7B|nr:cadherin-like beta sandwich domain-containing protein [Sediminispirochaeta bajacaliforniensis]